MSMAVIPTLVVKVAIVINTVYGHIAVKLLYGGELQIIAGGIVRARYKQGGGVVSTKGFISIRYKWTTIR